MAQGTRVSGNVFHDNLAEDLFVEVNHGPFLVDHNLFLSPTSLLDMSEGGAYAHNLFGGRLISRSELSRETPFHPAHSTATAGLVNIRGGDNRFFNNLFVGTGAASVTTGNDAGHGLWVYDRREYPQFTGGNVHLHGAKPHARETGARVMSETDLGLGREAVPGGVQVRYVIPAGGTDGATGVVTTARLGRAKVSGQAYEAADGTSWVLDRDARGRGREVRGPTPGPLEGRGSEEVVFVLRSGAGVGRE
jgi:hypothetical protein